MRRLGLLGEAVLITSPSNLFYFTQYRNNDVKLLYYKEMAYYFTDSRYFEEVRQLPLSLELCDIKIFDEFITNNKIKKLWIEDSISIMDYQHLQQLNIASFKFISKEISKFRAIKSEFELKNIKSAQAITDKTFLQIIPYIKEGITELKLGNILSSLLYQNGAESLAFDNIVAFGTDTSKPHAHPSFRKLSKGMGITLDFGAKFNGYCSDMTRTVFFGNPEKKVKDIYNLVLEAQELALENIKAGMTGVMCDAICRDFFAKKNLDKYFIHSLGHSFGIDIHENPNFSPKCDDIITEKMVLSVEPGLYFEGQFGIRIEDAVYFDKKHIINLTKSQKDMIIV
jgi:Xaa-Pro aminopeptidase